MAIVSTPDVRGILTLSIKHLSIPSQTRLLSQTTLPVINTLAYVMLSLKQTELSALTAVFRDAPDLYACIVLTKQKKCDILSFDKYGDTLLAGLPYYTAQNEQRMTYQYIASLTKERQKVPFRIKSFCAKTHDGKWPELKEDGFNGLVRCHYNTDLTINDTQCSLIRETLDESGPSPVWVETPKTSIF